MTSLKPHAINIMMLNGSDQGCLQGAPQVAKGAPHTTRLRQRLYDAAIYIPTQVYLIINDWLCLIYGFC